MSKETENKYQKRRALFWGALVHIALIFIAFILAYNSYKEIGTHLYDKYYLAKSQKIIIKSTFIWLALIFSTLYVLLSIWNKRYAVFLAAYEYRVVFILQAAIWNLIFFPKGHHVLIVLNFTLIYLAIFLTISLWAGVKFGIVETLTNRAPQRVFLQSVSDVITRRLSTYINEKVSALCFSSFMVLITLCAFLLFINEKAAEDLANIAYFALIIGVGIEVCRMITNNKYDTDDDG